MAQSILKADVVIVGAGIAGLGLACFLAPYNMSVVIIEKRKKAGGIHRGDSLLPKATELLYGIGLQEALFAKGGRTIRHMELHHKKRGLVYKAPLTEQDPVYPYLVLRHALIEEVLEERVQTHENLQLFRSSRFLGMVRDPETQRVSGVSFQGKDGLVKVHASLVVGCDGKKSNVARELGIVPELYEYDHAYLGLEAQRPASYCDAMRIHLHPEGGVLLMPHEDRVGIGMMVEKGSANYWMGMDDEELHKQVLNRVPILEGMALYREGLHVFSLTNSHAKRYASDGAVVIGDAIHSTNPTGGQGMAMALMDASVLAGLVGPVLESGAPCPDELLAQFQKQQHPENERLVRSTHKLSLFYGLRGRIPSALKLKLLELLHFFSGTKWAESIISGFLSRETE